MVRHIDVTSRPGQIADGGLFVLMNHLEAAEREGRILNPWDLVCPACGALTPRSSTQALRRFVPGVSAIVVFPMIILTARAFFGSDVLRGRGLLLGLLLVGTLAIGIRLLAAEAARLTICSSCQKAELLGVSELAESFFTSGGRSWRGWDA